MKSLATLELPCVAIDREVPDIPSVRVDHRGGGLEVTRYLTGLGQRRIALLTGSAAVLPSSERVAGYRQAVVLEALASNALRYPDDVSIVCTAGLLIGRL
jgi:LacI family transcriptional regulator